LLYFKVLFCKIFVRNVYSCCTPLDLEVDPGLSWRMCPVSDKLNLVSLFRMLSLIVTLTKWKLCAYEECWLRCCTEFVFSARPPLALVTVVTIMLAVPADPADWLRIAALFLDRHARTVKPLELKVGIISYSTVTAQCMCVRCEVIAVHIHLLLYCRYIFLGGLGKGWSGILFVCLFNP